VPGARARTRGTGRREKGFQLPGFVPQVAEFPNALHDAGSPVCESRQIIEIAGLKPRRNSCRGDDGQHMAIGVEHRSGHLAPDSREGPVS